MVVVVAEEGEETPNLAAGAAVAAAAIIEITTIKIKTQIITRQTKIKLLQIKAKAPILNPIKKVQGTLTGPQIQPVLAIGPKAAKLRTARIL